MKQNTASTKFIINTIAHVSGQQNISLEDSSDEEPNESFNVHFDINDKNTLPFRTFKIENKKGKTSIKREVGTFKNKEDVEYQKSNNNSSNIIQPFLDKLLGNGFETKEVAKNSIELMDIFAHKETNLTLINSVAVSIGLNRAKSLSSRKNNVLIDELQANIDTLIIYKKFGFYWEYNWYNQSNKHVPYQEVRSFYKQLKRIDKIKAEEFRAINEETAIKEKNVAVPYQELREYVKNHDKTKSLVKYFRSEDQNPNIYFSFVDSDTLDFNGIYGAYLRILNGSQNPYTVMSTGYEFVAYDLFKIASQVDRLIRVIISKHLELGVYFPEPNFCVLLPQGKETIPESFIDKTIEGNLESAVLLRQVKNRENFSSIFSEENPIITETPFRVSSDSNKLSEGFRYDWKATEADIKVLTTISQSHLDNLPCAKYLYINRGFRIDPNADYKSAGYVGKINKLLCNVGHSEVNDQAIIAELKNYIPNVADIEKIISAIYAKNQAIAEFIKENIRNPSIALHYAIVTGGTNIDIEKLIKSPDCDLNLIYNGYTAAHRTFHIYGKNEHILKLLINRGIDLNIQDKHGYTLAHYAAEEDNVELLKILYEKGANFNIKNTGNLTPFDLTTDCYAHNQAAYEFLLALTPLTIHQLVAGIKIQDINGIISFLEKTRNTINLNEETEFGLIFNIACGVGNIQIIELLIKYGCNPNLLDKNGKNGLHEACYADNIDQYEEGDRTSVISYLLNNIKLDINAQSFHGSTALSEAIWSRNISVIKFLLESGANPGLGDYNTPLLSLINCPRVNEINLDKIKLLIDHRADILICDKYVGNSLHLAAERGHIQVVDLLLYHAKQTNQLVQLLQPSPEECWVCKGMNAHQIALKYNHLEIANYLKTYKVTDSNLGITENFQMTKNIMQDYTLYISGISEQYNDEL